jgi:hypothetical protein
VERTGWSADSAGEARIVFLDDFTPAINDDPYGIYPQPQAAGLASRLATVLELLAALHPLGLFARALPGLVAQLRGWPATGSGT